MKTNKLPSYFNKQTSNKKTVNNTSQETHGFISLSSPQAGTLRISEMIRSFHKNLTFNGEYKTGSSGCKTEEQDQQHQDVKLKKSKMKRNE